MFSKVVTIETKFINNVELLFGFKYGITSGILKILRDLSVVLVWWQVSNNQGLDMDVAKQ